MYSCDVTIQTKTYLAAYYKVLVGFHILQNEIWDFL